jgi:betaine-homocysteine S-methyltransferase
MILERLEKDVVLGDGGMIFELERRGYVRAGPYTPEVVIQDPQVVRQLHIDFARAGADVIQACAYYAHEEKLKDIGMQGALAEINQTATRLAREVADEYGILVAGNLSNTWVYDAADTATHSETRRQFDEQIEYQGIEGTDFYIAETIEHLGEAKIALQAIRAAGMTAMITLGFKYQDKTLDGVELEEAFRQLKDQGADIVGINCFRDPDRMMPLAERLRKAVKGYIGTQPVAYHCSPDRPYFQAQEINGDPAFPLELDPFMLTRREMAAYALRARDAGIEYIGACCGAGPHHIRAMAEALGRTVPNSRYSPRLDLHPIVGSEEHIKEKDERILAEQRGRPKPNRR